MNKKHRIENMARSVRNRIEHNDTMLITSEPEIKRVGTLYYKRNAAASIDWMPIDQKLGRWDSVLKFAIRVRVTRRWQVRAGQYYTQEFDNLAIAQAAREGLNYHYARWLMAKGTGAAEYA